MIYNAKLISYTSPKTPDARGSSTGGTETVYTPPVDCNVGDPAKAFSAAAGGLVAEGDATLIIPSTIAPRPLPRGRVKFRDNLSGEDRTMEVLSAAPNAGGLPHYELVLKAI